MAEYEVGYKKLPRGRQYKKGDRANPNGRRGKKPKTFEAGGTFAVLRSRKVEVEIGGKIKRFWRTEYIVKQLAKLASKGNITAAAMLMEMHECSEHGGDPSFMPRYISEREAKIQRLLKKFSSE